MLDGSTRVKRLHAKRENLIKLTETFEALSSVAEMREDLSVLVESCDYAAALDVVDECAKLVSSPSLIGLRCLRATPARLRAIATTCNDVMTSDLALAAREGLHGGGGSGSDSTGGVPEAALASVEAASAASEAKTATAAAAAPPIDAASLSSADADAVEAMLPHACGLLRGDGGGARLAGALRAWGAAAASDVVDATRRAAAACCARAAAASAPSSTLTRFSVNGGADDAAIAEACRGMRAAAFDATIDAIRVALTPHFTRAAAVAASARRALCVGVGADPEARSIH